VASGRTLRHFDSKYGSFSAARFIRGRWVLGGRKQMGGPVQLWEADTGKMLGRLDTGDGGLHYFAFAPDGRTVACGGSFVCRLWDVATGKELRRFDGFLQGSPTGVTFSPDGKRLAAASSCAAIYLWDVATGKELVPPNGHRGNVDAVAVSPDARQIATAGWDQSLRLWDARTGKLRRRIPGEETNYTDVSFLPGGKGVMAAEMSRARLVHWDAAGNVVRRFPGFWRVACSPDGRRLAAVAEYRDQTIHLLDSGTGKRLVSFPAEVPGPLARVVFSPDGRLLAACGRGAAVRLWRTDTGALRRRFDTPRPASKLQDEIRAIAFSSDGRLLAAGLPDHTILVWDVLTGQERLRLTGHREGVRSLAFSPAHPLLASGSDDKTVRLWHVGSGQELRRFQGHEGAVLTLAWFPNGTKLVSGSDDTTVLIWDTSCVRRVEGAPLTVEERQRAWIDLADADGGKVHQAVWTLARSPQALAMLRQRVRPVAPLSTELAQQVRQWIADLESKRFTSRRAATAALAQLGEAAVPALRRALAGTTSLETRRRLEELLKKQQAILPSGDALRVLRAVEVLENTATAAARRLLQALAKGEPGARLTREAKAALDHWDRRPSGHGL
jgi:WD40 repeat protein